MDALEAIRTRRSVRVYRPAVLKKEALMAIADAGRLAASARNIQPCEFVAINDRARLQALGALCDTGAFIKDAAAAIVVVASDTKYYLEDGCAATQNMLIAATALGIGSCWVAGDKKTYAPKVLDFLGTDGKYKLISIVVLGLGAEQPVMQKRTLDEVLHWDTLS